MKNELSRAMASADVKVRYDTQCKRVLSQKEILARILARTVKEFAGMSVEEIIPCIEGTPEIAAVSYTHRCRPILPVFSASILCQPHFQRVPHLAHIFHVEPRIVKSCCQ